MENSVNYIEILIDSLQKKSRLLDKISEENERQHQVLKLESMDEEVFQDTMDKKQICIDELNQLDGGFQKVYDRVKETLQKEKERYAGEIQTMQKLIQEIMDKSMYIEKQEKRNRDLFHNKISNFRQKGRTVKTASKVASGYYQNMNKLNVNTPQFMDQKK